MDAWRLLNPDYSHELHDASDMRALIATEFDQTFLKIFDSLGQYQQKADLWRFCILYLKGGVYADADYALLSPLSKFVAGDLELALAICAPLVVDAMQPPVGCHTRAEAIKRLHNGFIAVAPRHPVLLLALQRLRWNFYRREDQHYLAAMGPGLLYEAYSSLYGDPLATVVVGPRRHGVLLGEDVAPFAGRGHHPGVLLLLEADRFIASVEPGGPVPRLLHKYPGWEEGIAQLREDNVSRVARRGTCLMSFR